MRFSLCLVAMLGLGMVVGAQVTAPEFTAQLMEQRKTGVRLSGGVTVHLGGTVEIEADEAVIDNTRPNEIRLTGNVIARRAENQPPR